MIPIDVPLALPTVSVRARRGVGLTFEAAAIVLHLASNHRCWLLALFQGCSKQMVHCRWWGSRPKRKTYTGPSHPTPVREVS